MNVEEKLKIAETLEALSVDVIEAGFMIVSRGETVNEIAELIRNAAVCVLARSPRQDIERAAEALRPTARGRIHAFIATSPLHMKYKLQMEPEDVYRHVVDSVAHERRFTDDVDWAPPTAAAQPRFCTARIP